MLSEVHVLEGHSDLVRNVAFSPNSAFLLSGSNDETVRVWNVQTREAIEDPLTGHTDYVPSVVFSPDGTEFASGSRDGTVRIWDARVRTDLALYKQSEEDYSELNEEELRIRWNGGRASSTEAENDGWHRDGEKLLCWAPWQYRHDIKVGTKLVIGDSRIRTVRPEVDYRKLFRFSGTRWKDIYMSDGKGKEKSVLGGDVGFNR